MDCTLHKMQNHLTCSAPSVWAFCIRQHKATNERMNEWAPWTLLYPLCSDYFLGHIFYLDWKQKHTPIQIHIHIHTKLFLPFSIRPKRATIRGQRKNRKKITRINKHDWIIEKPRRPMFHHKYLACDAHACEFNEIPISMLCSFQTRMICSQFNYNFFFRFHFWPFSTQAALSCP